MLTTFKGFGQPPAQSPQSSNTGVSTSTPSLIALIDWCQGTFPFSNLPAVSSLVSSFLQCDWVERTFGIRFYEHSSSCAGALVAWSPRVGGKVVGRTDAFLSLPGSVLACLSPDNQLQLFNGLLNLGFRCSRIDLTLDDYLRRFRPSDAAAVYESGGVTGFRKGGFYSSRESPKHQPSETAYFGSRGKSGSGKFARIYDKPDCTRIEVAYYGDYSKQVFESLASVPGVDLWCEAIPGYISASINFLEVPPGKEARADRCPRVSWWESIFADKVAIRLQSKKIEKTIDKTMRWWCKQVSPNIAMIIESFGIMGKSQDDFWQWFWESVFAGQSRWNEKHLEILEDIRMKMNLMMVT